MKRDTEMESIIRQKFEILSQMLNEKTRRLWAAVEARALGYGGDALVSAATGIARETIRWGHREIEAGVVIDGSIREPGGGRPSIEDTQPGLEAALDRLVSPVTRGDPMSPLRWTCKSKETLATELCAQGWKVSPTTVGRMLHAMGYSLQSVRKSLEGTSQHPDRNAQFEHINATAEDFQARNQPVISVDTKKKELVGNFKNAGREWQPKGQPEKVQGHDFPDLGLGKAIPYGVYDVARNEACVNVGQDHDTPAFAVASIRQWWKSMGSVVYPDAKDLLITADSGGSNGYRPRAWKLELQGLADEIGLRIRVCHFPPGTSKWNKIEHRLFCHITENWRGRPLVDYETIVNLIGTTCTFSGLHVNATLDCNNYPVGRKITDKEMKQVEFIQSEFHGEWNYEIRPHA